jgi:hypothetical protein
MSRTKDSALLVGFVSALATLVLVALQSRVLPDLQVGPAWAATAIALLIGGHQRKAADLRWQSYVLLGAAALRTAGPVFVTSDPSTAAIVWLSVVIGALYVSGLIVRRVAGAANAAGPERAVDDAAGAIALLGATGLLSRLITHQVRRRPSRWCLACRPGLDVRRTHRAASASFACRDSRCCSPAS